MNDQVNPSATEDLKGKEPEFDQGKAKAPELEVPTPPKDADFNAIAAMHNTLLEDGKHEIAAAFHKKHVLGFKAKGK